MTLSMEAQNSEEIRYEPDVGTESEGESYPIDQFDLVASPNDFNTKTLVDFIDSGVVTIPGFQRNYAWDIKRASRLIESIMVGLPVPQIFLYEQGHNKHLVIDGQQRLMSIYYFVKGRFPRKEKLAELRLIGGGQSTIPADKLSDDEYFSDFRLSLPESIPGRPNRYNRLGYSSLDEDQLVLFNLRTIRHIIVRQVGPSGDDAMYEIFNRLNSGGINLTPQEIRRCAFDSKFYEVLYETNTQDTWRQLVGTTIPDIHMRDVEILLRGFAMLISGESYRPSMVKFLNLFSRQAKSFDEHRLQQLRQLLDSFLASCRDLPSNAFHSVQSRFSPMIFESVFVAVCGGPYQVEQNVEGRIQLDSLNRLKEDTAFRSATQSETASQLNVRTRIDRAREILELA